MKLRGRSCRHNSPRQFVISITVTRHHLQSVAFTSSRTILPKFLGEGNRVYVYFDTVLQGACWVDQGTNRIDQGQGTSIQLQVLMCPG